MTRTRIITDMTAQLAPEVIGRYQLTILPMEIRFGAERFRLGPGDSPEPLYARMAGSRAQPAEARVPVAAMQKAYEQLSRQADEILVIVNSARLSNAYATAQAASRAFLGRCRITVIDSMNSSRGLGLVVEAAARAAAGGYGVDEIVRLVRGLLPHIYLAFFVERLDYLEQWGRISPAQALLGTMLRIKPLLLVEDGQIVPLEKVRTLPQALEKLADFVQEFAAVQQVTILHGPLGADRQALVEELKGKLSLILPKHKFPVMEYDPVLACHLGPEALGVVVYEKM